MPSSADTLDAAFDASDGTIDFAEFMRLALYGADGFYTRSGQAGRRGDFLTSPEVGPLFGAVLANAIDGWWHELGQPSDFTVVEVGAGPGTLARAVLAARPQTHYIAVEISAAQREQHPNTVESRADLPAAPISGVVIANELLDNLPFGLAVFDGRWREARVRDAGGGRYEELLGEPIDPLPTWLPARAPHGARAPLQHEASAWVQHATASLAAGRVVAIDYAVARTAELALRPWREWLRTYRDHERGGHYLADPGAQDVTADVCLDQLPAADTVRTQAQFLQRWGIDELVEEGKREWQAAAGAPDLRAMKMRSRIGEAEALLDPAGLGGFYVLEWGASCGTIGQ